jgi:hypothetical protein
VSYVTHFDESSLAYGSGRIWAERLDSSACQGVVDELKEDFSKRQPTMGVALLGIFPLDEWRDDGEDVKGE